MVFFTWLKCYVFCGILTPDKMKKSELYFNVLRLPVDFLMLVLAGIATYFLRTEILSSFRPVLFEFNLPFTKYFYLVSFVSFVFLMSYAISGLYSLKVRRRLFDELLKIIMASSAGIMVVIIYIFLRQELFDSRFLVLGGWFFAIVFVFIGRLSILQLQRFCVSKRNFGVHNLVIIGNDDLAVAVLDKVNNDPTCGYKLSKHLLLPSLDEIRKNQSEIDEIILTTPNYPEEQILELVDFCHENHIIFKYIPNMHKTLTANFDMDVIGGLPLIELKRTRLDGWGKVIKRVIDVSASALGLVFLSPLYLVVAVVIKIDSAGPVFVRLKRISRNKEFSLIKFRSMIENAEELKASLAVFNERKDGPLFKIRNDPRVTKTGKFIRRFRIDELPQLWNVLTGDISLVGPRPHQPDEILLYKKHHKKVLAIKAGATGLAQVSGSSNLPFEQEVVLDIFYIENWSLWMDIKIILKTMFKMFTDKSAV